MSSEWLPDAQVRVLNELIQKNGYFQLSAAGVRVFGGLDELREHFTVTPIDGTWRLTTRYAMTATVSSGSLTINTGSTTTTTGTLVANHHEGKNGMEHHVDRLKLIETVEANKTAYDHIFERFQELYRAEIEKKTEEHVQGKIRSDQIMVRDEQGQIPVPANHSTVYDDQLTVLNTDVRDVMILDDAEFHAYVMAGHTNLQTVAQLTERLEAI